MLERQQIDSLCKDMTTLGYEPVIRTHPLYGTIDVMILREPRGSTEHKQVDAVLRRWPFRALLDESTVRRNRLQREYEVPTYHVWKQQDGLAKAVDELIDEHAAEFEGLSGRESLFCARVRVASMNVRPDQESPILAIVKEDLLIKRVYEGICPSAVVGKMVYTPGFVVLNAYPKPEPPQIFLQKARHAEDIPELRRTAEENEKKQRGTA